MDDDSLMENDLMNDELDMEVPISFEEAPEPSRSALDRLAAAGAGQDDYMDDELVNQEDPYLQDLLAPYGTE
jgi:hypothetical protein